MGHPADLSECSCSKERAVALGVAVGADGITAVVADGRVFEINFAHDTHLHSRLIVALDFSELREDKFKIFLEIEKRSLIGQIFDPLGAEFVNFIRLIFDLFVGLTLIIQSHHQIAVKYRGE